MDGQGLFDSVGGRWVGCSSMYTPDAPLRGGLTVAYAKGPFRPQIQGGFTVGRLPYALIWPIADSAAPSWPAL